MYAVQAAIAGSAFNDVMGQPGLEVATDVVPHRQG